LAFAIEPKSKRISLGVPHGGARKVAVEGRSEDDGVTSTNIFSSKEASQGMGTMFDDVNVRTRRLPCSLHSERFEGDS
jgi:hypothetical protein